MFCFHIRRTFLCVLSSLLIKGVLDLSQRLVFTWSYPRIITLGKVAWINSMGAEHCSRRSYLEYKHIWMLCLNCSFLTFSGISCVRREASLFVSWIWVEKRNRVLSCCLALEVLKPCIHSLNWGTKPRLCSKQTKTSLLGGWSALRYACKYLFGVTWDKMIWDPNSHIVFTQLTGRGKKFSDLFRDRRYWRNEV